MRFIYLACVAGLFILTTRPAMAQWEDDPTLYIYDSCHFESPCDEFILDKSNSAGWQIGQLGKKPCLSPDSNCMGVLATDTLLPYHSDSTYFFEVELGDWAAPHLTFRHMWDFQPGDGGYITVSFDEGLTWQTIEENHSDVQPFIWWEERHYLDATDSLANGARGFSGTQGWTTTSLVWVKALPIQRAGWPGIILRFNLLTSGSNTHYSGWIIDWMGSGPMDLGSYIDTKNRVRSTLVFPNPATQQLQLDLPNVNPARVSIVDLRGSEIEQRLWNGNPLSIGHLAPGTYLLRIQSDDEVSFARFVKQ